MKMFLAYGFLVLMLLPFVASGANSNVYFGPQVFERTSGAPNEYDASFAAIPGAATLVVFNGDDEQESRVSSATITLNGLTVLSQSDLNQTVDRVLRSVTLTASDAMHVTVDGDPGGYITVLVINGTEIPEFTAGRITLVWTTISDPNAAISLRLKNDSFRYDRYYRVRFFNEDGSLAGVSSQGELAAHASLNASAQSFLPPGAVWQTGSIEISFCGRGGARMLGYGLQTTSSTETVIPLQWGGIRHYFKPVKTK